MRNEIRISKKLCTKIETRFQRGIEVQMLPTSQYSGYKFFVSDSFAYKLRNFYEIGKSSNSAWRFTLERIDREPGKRYARPKLTFEELQAEFADHSAQFYTDTLPQALAYTKTYADDGTRNAGRVMGAGFCIGGYDKTWFYESDDERRRLNTNGVRILKRLAPEEVKPMKEKLARFHRLKNRSEDHRDCFINDDYFIRRIERTLEPEAVKKVMAKVAEINQIISDERAAMQTELDELDKYFKAFLEGEGVNTDE